MAQVSRRIVLASHPNGSPKLSDFRFEEVTLPEVADGQMLLEIEYLTVDPYMRGRMDDRPSYIPPVPLGDLMGGEGIARVIESQCKGFSVGDTVLANTGWQTHAISDGHGVQILDSRFQPVTTALGVLGMPGFTAYIGLEKIGKPTPGETVVVAAASGPVGSMVGQIAHIGGTRVVGIAGSAEKCAFLTNELGFDVALNRREPNLPERLAKACPQGIDVYFENVGGAVWDAVFPLLNRHARVPVCGLIAQYNGMDAHGPDRLPATMGAILTRRLRIQGFLQFDYADQRPQFLEKAAAWIAQGSVHFKEDIVVGLDRTPEAFIGMLDGKNFGKLIIQVNAG